MMRMNFCISSFYYVSKYNTISEKGKPWETHGTIPTALVTVKLNALGSSLT